MKKILFYIVTFLLISGACYFFFNSAPAGSKGGTFIVKYGETLNEVSTRLKGEGHITSITFFKIQSYVLQKKFLKAGKYKIYPSMSSFDIISTFARGKVISKKITIPEGFNIFQISERLEANAVTDSKKMLYYLNNEEFLKSIGIESKSAEGYLFPDTYVFAEESDPRDIISMMTAKMFSELKKLNQQNSKMDTHQLLVLASLIEEEAQVKTERPYISAVFHNRIRLNMKLECDPTVRYAVKKFTGRITYRDLASDSPYNTYRHKGLPPTPICSPGAASIKAALNPAESGFLFFVARNNGSHYFSTNLREHSRAVDFYQKGLKNGFIDRQKL